MLLSGQVIPRTSLGKYCARLSQTKKNVLPSTSAATDGLKQQFWVLIHFGFFSAHPQRPLCNKPSTSCFLNKVLWWQGFAVCCEDWLCLSVKRAHRLGCAPCCRCVYH